MRPSAGTCSSVTLAISLLAYVAVANPGSSPGNVNSNTPGFPAPASTANSKPEPIRSGLKRMNYYRVMANLPELNDDPILDSGAALHARYLIENNLSNADMKIERGVPGLLPTGEGGRHEEKNKPGYSEAGAAAAPFGLILRSDEEVVNGLSVIDKWIATPFGGLTLLNPQVTAVGFGQHCANRECVGVLAFRFGLDRQDYERFYEGSTGRLWNPALGAIPPTAGRLRTPIEFPPNGAEVSIASYNANDSPNPLSSCLDYKAPTGSPIFLQLGKGLSGEEGEVKVSAHSISDEDVQIESCAIDAVSYRISDSKAQALARGYLYHYGAVVLIPRKPLQPGHTYKVSIDADSKLYEWSFRIGQPSPTR
ncbi:MAG TPA: CAP domain-containing protein [Candidatus Binataceae bacterium]